MQVAASTRARLFCFVLLFCWGFLHQNCVDGEKVAGSVAKAGAGSLYTVLGAGRPSRAQDGVEGAVVAIMELGLSRGTFHSLRMEATLRDAKLVGY